MGVLGPGLGLILPEGVGAVIAAVAAVEKLRAAAWASSGDPQESVRI